MGLSPDQLRQALGIAEYHGPRSQMMREIATPTMLHDGSGMGALVGSMAFEAFSVMPFVHSAFWSAILAIVCHIAIWSIVRSVIPIPTEEVAK